MVLDLRAELQKVKEAARVAREALKASKTTSYKHGVMKTETRLAEEVAGVYRDYCTKTWAKALNWAGVPADSELRRTKNVFFPDDIREILAMLPPSVADPLSPPGQLPTIKPLLLMLKT